MFDYHALAVIATVIGATWTLRSKLGGIESAIKVLNTQLTNLSVRVSKLEDDQK